jgi:hypothetical protein
MRLVLHSLSAQLTEAEVDREPIPATSVDSQLVLAAAETSQQTTASQSLVVPASVTD